MKHFCLSLAFILFVVPSLLSQNIKLLTGSLKSLKGQQSYNITFTYDSMVVGTNTLESAYLAEKKSQWEAKEPGKGSAFVEMWVNDRKKRYEPAFIQNFEHYSNIKLGDSTAKYTLLVKTTRTEGGWYIGVASHFGEIDGELWVVESANKSHVIAKIAFLKSKGKNQFGNDFEMTIRIKSAYAQAGRWLGDFLRRKSK
jgi:hypothetical protein